MNILYHHRTQASGAAGHHIREMVKAFRDLGHSVDIVSPPGVKGSFEKNLGSQKKNRYAIPQFLFELFEIFYNFVAFVKLQGQLKKKKYSLIYERYAIFNVAGILAAKINHKPIIIEASFTSKADVFPKRTKLLTPLAYRIDKLIFNRADGIVVVSSVLKESLIKDFGVSADKIIVLPNAVDAKMFEPQVSGDTVRNKYSLNSNKIVGFVGGFYPWHGLNLLLDAAEDVLKILPNVKFLLIGDGPLRKKLEDRVNGSSLKNSVIFTGSIAHNELPQYIACFDIGVMPDSNDYGSPIKIFEYMAMGKPVLAPKIGPIEEAVEDGKNGLLFERNNEYELANAIIQLLKKDNLLYRKISSDCRAIVLEKHTWIKNAQSILFRWQDIIKEKTEVRFILQYFHPEVASTAQLMTELAQGLVLKGCAVKAICGQPTYVKSRKLPKRETFKGIEIERLPCTRLEKNSSIGRLLNWLSYTFLVFFKLLFSRDKSPIFIVSQPPFLFVVGYLLKVIRNQKYVCLIYDLYPDIAIKLGFMKEKSLIGKLWDRCNRTFFKNADFVVVPSENMGTLIERKIGSNGAKESRVKVIYNWADGEFIKPLNKKDNWFSKKYDLVDKLTVLYAGNIGLFHELETIIEAADKLKTNKNIKFVFIGEGGKKEKLMNMAKDKKLENVLFLPYQDKDILPYSLTCGDVSVVSLEKNLDCVAAPCKLYTSMAAGQIILGLVDRNSDVAKIVDKYQCGFCAQQDDVNRAVEILTSLCNNLELANKLKVNARKCFEDNFCKDKSIEQYFEIFKNVQNQKEEVKMKNSTIKTTLVTGAGGFIGSHLVKLLKKEGYWVRGVDLKYPEFSPTAADDFIIGDLRDPVVCNRVTDQPFDELYQLAADMGGAGYIFTGENDAHLMHNSAMINLNMLEAARKAGVKKIFYSSSACIYPEYNQLDPNNPKCSEDSAYPAAPDSEYGWEKLFSERLYLAYHRNYGMGVHIARFHNIFGEEGTWEGGREKAPAALCRKVAETEDGSEIEIWGDGKQTRSFLYIDECLEGIRRLIKSDVMGPVNIGSDEMVTINDLADMIMQIAGKNLRIKHIKGPTGVRGRNSDNTLIRKLLGWAPSCSLKTGLGKTYPWIAKQVEARKAVLV